MPTIMKQMNAISRAQSVFRGEALNNGELGGCHHSFVLAICYNPGMSQEQLAEKISVSRQSVSKWEMDQAAPQIDKIVQLCELFDISTDELLHDKIAIKKIPTSKNKYFGTDGIRGVANKELDIDLATEVAQAAGTVLKERLGRKPNFVIGWDTRLSSSMLQSAMTAGLCSVGCDVQLLGVVPTPGVAYLVKKLGADAGIMLTASHNPFMDNGIKIISGNGFKLSDEEEEEIVEEEEDSIYINDNGNIVAVTYGGKNGNDHEAYKTFILNYNNFAVTVKYEVNGETRVYTIPANRYVVIIH